MENVPELAKLADLPVIFISAYRRDETIAKALETGAADYIVKPFSPTELTARVQAALRRQAGPEAFLLGDLAIDYERRRVTVAGRVVTLTASEYELVRLLSVNAGRVTTYDSLLRQLWSGRKSGGDMRAVRAFVKRVRRKLGDDATRDRRREPESRRGLALIAEGADVNETRADGATALLGRPTGTTWSWPGACSRPAPT